MAEAQEALLATSDEEAEVEAPDLPEYPPRRGIGCVALYTQQGAMTIVRGTESNRQLLLPQE
jgi:hypothetical protein